ncbi:MAG: ISAs1 family transposase [Phycisphaerales bacterium]|nr:ISAs1 family transposase [Phycisphaerales bacterium]
MMRTLPPRQRRLARAERQTAHTVSKGHGRLETRTLSSTTQLDADYLGFPGVVQCFRLIRTRTIRERHSGILKTTTETAYGITSLPRQRASADQLLAIVRAHWGIENKVFHVRDQTLGEDACRVRKCSAPIILSALRNSVLNVLQTLGVKNRAAQLRTFCANPVKALEAIRRKISEN